MGLFLIWRTKHSQEPSSFRSNLDNDQYALANIQNCELAEKFWVLQNFILGNFGTHSFSFIHLCSYHLQEFNKDNSELRASNTS